MKNKKLSIALLVTLLIILIFVYLFFKGAPMEVFYKDQDNSYEEIQADINESIAEYKKVKQDNLQFETKKIFMNFSNLHPPNNSYIAVISSKFDQIIYMGKYHKQIELIIPSYFYTEGNGRDYLQFNVYSPDTLTVYVSSQKFSSLVWQENKDINITFLPRRIMKNDYLTEYIVKLTEHKE